MKKLVTMTMIVCFCSIISASLASAETAKEQTRQSSQTDFSLYLDNIEMVSVPGGCFQMGSNADPGRSDEKPVHEVCVSDYQIGKYEVTQGLWQAVMKNNPSHFQKGPDHPVEMVTWQDTQTFLKKLNAMTGKNFRLPTEAEWEYACFSGGKDEKFCGGNDADELAWYNYEGGKTTKKVGTKKPNGLGIYDMDGNVEEWVQDWYGKDYYASSPKHNPTGPAVEPEKNYGHVIRGGGWESGQADLGAERDSGRSGKKTDHHGFRLAHPQ